MVDDVHERDQLPSGTNMAKVHSGSITTEFAAAVVRITYTASGPDVGQRIQLQLLSRRQQAEW
jgi:hypothetical protein